MRLVGHRDDQGIVEHHAAREADAGQHETDERELALSLPHEIEPGRHGDAQGREQQQKALAQASHVGDGAEHRRQDHDHGTGKGIGQAQLKGALGRRQIGAPPALEKDGKETGQHRGGEGRVGPVIEGP